MGFRANKNQKIKSITKTDRSSASLRTHHRRHRPLSVVTCPAIPTEFARCVHCARTGPTTTCPYRFLTQRPANRNVYAYGLNSYCFFMTTIRSERRPELRRSLRVDYDDSLIVRADNTLFSDCTDVQDAWIIRKRKRTANSFVATTAFGAPSLSNFIVAVSCVIYTLDVLWYFCTWRRIKRQM